LETQLEPKFIKITKNSIMKNIKNLLFLSFFCSLVLFTNCADSDDPVVGESSPPFYLDDNGITIKAKDGVTAGTTGELDGVTYTAVDNTMEFLPLM
jgi:hypothetical protein